MLQPGLRPFVWIDEACPGNPNKSGESGVTPCLNVRTSVHFKGTRSRTKPLKWKSKKTEYLMSPRTRMRDLVSSVPNRTKRILHSSACIKVLARLKVHRQGTSLWLGLSTRMTKVRWKTVLLRVPIWYHRLAPSTFPPWLSMLRAHARSLTVDDGGSVEGLCRATPLWRSLSGLVISIDRSILASFSTLH